VVAELGDQVAGHRGQPRHRAAALAAGRADHRVDGGAEPGVVAGQPGEDGRRAVGGEEQPFLVADLPDDLRAQVGGQRLELALGPAALGGHREQVPGAGGDLGEQLGVFAGQGVAALARRHVAALGRRHVPAHRRTLGS
jgi:hypothetical protein